MNEFLKTWLAKRNRVVVFAGVFDPVHKGHLSAAEKALYYGSDLVFLPERVPQHKHGATAYEHRFNMLKIATKNQKNMQVLDYPRKHQWIEPTFTWLNQQFPGKQFVWLVGNDVASQIESWPGSESLKALDVELVVVIKRDGLDDQYIQKIHDSSVINMHRARKRHEKISSSFIRADLKRRHTALPPGVYDYIKEHNLY